jgi:hypothetical protein
MRHVISVAVILTCASPQLLPAQDKQQPQKSPGSVAKAFFQDPKTDIASFLFNQPADPSYAKEFAKLRESQGKQMEVLFEIQDGTTAVVGMGIRSEKYRQGIDIDPLFMVDRNGWKILAVGDEDELNQLLRTLPANTAQQIRSLKTKFDKKSEEIYAATAKERAKPLAITKKNIQGLWNELAEKKMFVMNFEANDKFVTGYVSNGKFFDRVAGDWSIVDGKLVLTGDGGKSVRRYVIEKSTVDRLVLVSEGNPQTKSTLKKTPDAIIQIFPAIRAGK